MRWLVIALFVSLLALLIAAAALARHILLQRARIRSNPSAGAVPVPGPAEESDVETEV